jgi:hypothetical protein
LQKSKLTLSPMHGASGEGGGAGGRGGGGEGDGGSDGGGGDGRRGGHVPGTLESPAKKMRWQHPPPRSVPITKSKLAVLVKDMRTPAAACWTDSSVGRVLVGLGIPELVDGWNRFAGKP